MKLTKAQEIKTLEVTTQHDYDEKYMVILKEGFFSDGEEVAFFNTQKEVKEFINSAEFKEVPTTNETKATKVTETVYSGFYNSYMYTTNNGTEKIATAINGKHFEGFTELRIHDLHNGTEGATLVLDVVLKELVKYKKALKEGREVDVYVEWTLSKDRTEYTSCKHIKTEVSKFDTYKERIEGRVKALGCRLGVYDKNINELSESAFNEVVDCADEEYTDVVVVSNKKQYVVEIATVDNEKDFTLYTKNEYIGKYGEEYKSKFE